MTSPSSRDRFVATWQASDSLSQESWAAVLADSHTDLVGLRCLLVEDHATRAETERRLLIGLGAHVVVVESLEQARRILEMAPFDIAIVEIGLPEGCGSECVRTALGGIAPPVLFVSGNSQRPVTGAVVRDGDESAGNHEIDGQVKAVRHQVIADYAE